MRRRLRSILILLSCFCTVTALHSQMRPAYGATFDFNLNSYTADFRAFPGVPSCCPLYQNGSGSGLSFGALVELPLGNALGLALRAEYEGRGGTLTRTETTTLSGNISGTFEHRVDASLSDLGLEPLVQYQVYESLWLNVGGRAGFVTTKSFSQKESILTPTNAVFPSGSSTRNEYSNIGIPNASSLYAAAVAGLIYELPLNAQGTMIAAPEIFYSYGLTPVVSGLKWNSNILHIGVSLLYAPELPKEPVERREERRSIDTVTVQRQVVAQVVLRGRDSVREERHQTAEEIVITSIVSRTDTLVVPAPPKPPVHPFDVTLRVVGVDSAGAEQTISRLQVEEFSSVLMTPLLNYVFFDDSSDAIPSRYVLLNRSAQSSFDENRINSSDRLTTYHEILNIVAKRMQENADATISLVGCNANLGSEKANTALSKRRAEAIKKYLHEVWGIADERMSVSARNLPEKATLSQQEEGHAENRRVELYSNSAAITAPIITRDTFRTASPRTIRFLPQISHLDHPSQWSLVVRQGATLLAEFKGADSLPRVVDWTMERDGSFPRTDAAMTAALSVTDSAQRVETAVEHLPVEQLTIQQKKRERRQDKEVDRFSLILFDVRSAEITTMNRPIIDLIQKNIYPTSTVTIRGYTDRLGDESINQNLAGGRAASTAAALKIDKKRLRIESNGNAETYDATLPEGRLYTRTVDVIIETPVTE